MELPLCAVGRVSPPRSAQNPSIFVLPPEIISHILGYVLECSDLPPQDMLSQDHDCKDIVMIHWNQHRHKRTVFQNFKPEQLNCFQVCQFFYAESHRLFWSTKVFQFDRAYVMYNFLRRLPRPQRRMLLSKAKRLEAKFAVLDLHKRRINDMLAACNIHREGEWPDLRHSDDSKVVTFVPRASA